MRRPLTFACEGATLAGMAHPADGDTGVLIVTGGVQTRTGAHRGFVDLADRLAAAGHPVLRFDRRGVGDSGGDDPGFRDSAPDIIAAVTALRTAYPNIRRVIGWGLCDAASALALHGASLGLDGLILVNPWTRDSDDPADLPPRAAVAARYRERLTNPRAWLRLARDGFNLRKAAQGLLRLGRKETVPQLARATADGLQRFDGPVLILLAGRDATAQAFAALWKSATFRLARARRDIEVATLADATHTFARATDANAMAERCLEWLRRGSSGQT
jgi:exosortase A-associated hydrolase 1